MKRMLLTMLATTFCAGTIYAETTGIINGRLDSFTQTEEVRIADDVSSSTSPLRMDYSIEDIGGGLYDYTFTVTLDNNDGSWAAGQSWGWLIFGDAESVETPLTNFVGDPDDLPIGPWDGYTTSGGFHNGPTLNYVLDCWQPTSVGESLSWSGTSDADLSDELLWSCIYSCGGSPNRPDFTPAYLVSAGGLEVVLSNYPASVEPGTALAFRADAVNSGDAAAGFDNAEMVVTGPASLTKTLYSGGDIMVPAGNSVGTTISLNVPPGAPVGSYHVEVSIYDDGEMISGDGFDVDVSSGGGPVSDEFDWGEDTSSHNYAEFGSCSAGSYSCTTDSRRIGSCGDDTGWAEITVAVAPGADEIDITYLAPWLGGNGAGSAMYVDDVYAGELEVSAGCAYSGTTLSGMSSHTADGEVFIHLEDASDGCNGDIQITYMWIDSE